MVLKHVMEIPKKYGLPLSTLMIHDEYQRLRHIIGSICTLLSAMAETALLDNNLN